MAHTDGVDLADEKEIRILQRARHPNLILFIGCGQWHALMYSESQQRQTCDAIQLIGMVWYGKHHRPRGAL